MSCNGFYLDDRFLATIARTSGLTGMNLSTSANPSNSLIHWGARVGIVLTLGLAACVSTDAPDADDAGDADTASAEITPEISLGQEMAYINWFYCGNISYYTQIQYWKDSRNGITVGAIDVQQYHSSSGIDYTVQIKTVYDDHRIWWSRGPGTTSGPHLRFAAASTPATVFPVSWTPYVRLFLGADGDGLSNCNFDALLN